MPCPLAASRAKVVRARLLLWPVGVAWLSSLLLLVRATEQNPLMLPGQCASIQSEHMDWGCVCRSRHGEFTEAMPLASAATVRGKKGPLPFLLQSFLVQDSRVTGPEGCC